jgi:hypothetical protein
VNLYWLRDDQDHFPGQGVSDEPLPFSAGFPSAPPIIKVGPGEAVTANGWVQVRTVDYGGDVNLKLGLCYRPNGGTSFITPFPATVNFAPPGQYGTAAHLVPVDYTLTGLAAGIYEFSVCVSQGDFNAALGPRFLNLIVVRP